MSAVLQPVCSILMNTSLLRRLVNASHQLKCSVCLVQVLNLVCVLFESGATHYANGTYRTDHVWKVQF